MKTSYKSVPVIASIIGTKTRKSMYIYHVTSLDGETIYQDRYVPVRWGDNVTIEWEQTNDMVVQFPLSDARPIMIIPKYNDIGISNIVSHRLPNGKIQNYYEMTSRYIVYIPMWLFLQQTKKDEHGNPVIKRDHQGNKVVKTHPSGEVMYHEGTTKPVYVFEKDPNTGFKAKYTKFIPSIASQEDEKLYTNDDSPYTIAEDTAYKSEQELNFDYRPSADTMLTGLEFENDSLAQWEIENPEYASDNNLLFN